MGTAILPRPRHQLFSARERHLIGSVRRTIDYTRDTVSRWQSFDQMQKNAVYVEETTSRLTLAPRPIPRSVNLTDLSITPYYVAGDLGEWETVSSRLHDSATGVAQGSSVAAVAWNAQTTDAAFIGASAPFTLRMQVGAVGAGGGHTAQTAFRRVTWPANARPGEGCYRFTLAFGEGVKIEYSEDGGATWPTYREVPCGFDLSQLRYLDNPTLDFTFWPVEGDMVAFCGEISGHGAVLSGLAPPKAGPMRFSGAEGFARYDFSDLRFLRAGHVDSYPQPGPSGVDRLAPTYQYSGGIDSAKGQAVRGSIIERNKALGEFRYRLALSAPPIAHGSDFAASTPSVEGVTVVWPPSYVPPRRVRMVPERGVLEIKEQKSFDLSTGLLASRNAFTLDNTYGERAAQAGVNACEHYLGYEGFGPFFRGISLGNTDGAFVSDEGMGTYSAGTGDLSYVLARNFLKRRLNPTRWCVYALVRFAAIHGGLAPPLLSRIQPGCRYGPDPVCNHTKFPFHPDWEPGTPVLSVMGECREIEQAWMGQDADGFYRFEPFVFNVNRRPVRTFQDFSGSDAQGLNGMLTQIDAPFVRNRTLATVRNDVQLMGFLQADGRVAVHHPESAATLASKYDPYAPNYLGFPSALLHLWTGYSTVEFMQYSGAKLLQRVPLAGETCLLRCAGQPDLWPMDLVYVREPRCLPSGALYWVTNTESLYRYGEDYDSVIEGTWTGIGPVPGS